MADRDQLYTALRNADKAGDTDGAKKLAAYIQSLPAERATEEKPKDLSWTDVPLEAIKSIPSSAGNFVSGIAQAVAHPVDSVTGLLDAAAGGLKNSLPTSVSGLIDKADWNPQAADRAIKTADAVGDVYKKRYGSSEGIKNTLATDPIGVAGDLSTIFGGGAALTGGKVSGMLSKASQVTNPLSAIAPIARGIGKVAEPVGSNTLGLTTGVGAENIRTAARSGFEGKTSFMDNLSGRAGMTDVLDASKQNVQNMGAQKAAEYRSGMANIKLDKTVLDFADIDNALNSATDKFTYKGRITNPEAAKVTRDMYEVIDQWKQLNPSEYHTPEGMDALKKALSGIQDSIPYEQKTANAAAGEIYNAVKRTINAQAPEYSKVMKNYSEASDTIREIERSLSLKPGASVDTAMRKLQSLSHNNVNTNYGNRLELAKQLEQQGGNEILPAIAGQAMNSWTPRSMVGQGGGLATLGAAIAHPALALALPFQSPKAVGSALYAAGKGANALSNIKTPLLADQLKTLALLLKQSNSVVSENGQNDERR